MAEPSYWEGLDWSFGWDDMKPVKVAISQTMSGNNGREVVNSTDRMNTVPLNILELIAAFSSGGGFQSAFLDPNSFEFKAIANYLTANAVARSLSPPQGERTRMAHALRLIGELRGKLEKKPDDDSSKKQLVTHLKTLLEKPSYITRDLRPLYGQYGITIKTTKPVRSGGVQITAIRVIKNMNVWEIYEKARRNMGAEITQQRKTGKTPLTTGGKLWGRNALTFTSTGDTGLTQGSGDKLPVLDRSLGELLLMHGTGADVVKIIAEQGFDPIFNKGTEKDGVRKFGAMGRGTYFSDSFAKVQTYSRCPLCAAMKCECTQDGKRIDNLLILARCLIGIPTKSRHPGGLREDNVNTIKDGKHSVVGPEGGLFKSWTFWGSNEFLIKSADQMYPEFVVSWHRA